MCRGRSPKDDVPVATFGPRTCYWTPRGFAVVDNVWEYYFEPLDRAHPAASLPDLARAAIASEPPSAFDIGYRMGAGSLVTAHFGDHPELRGNDAGPVRVG